MLIWIDCFQVILVFLLFQPAIKGKYQLNVLGQLLFSLLAKPETLIIMKFYFIECEDKRKQNAFKVSSLYSICHRTQNL